MAALLTHYRKLAGMAKGWAVKALPGWSDEAHRDLLARHGAQQVDGRTSASTMSAPQLRALLEDYGRRGWPGPTSQARQAKPVPPHIAHIVRLWSRLGQAGKLEHDTRPALLAWCGRQLGTTVADLDSLSATQCQRITEALKAWLARE